MNVLMSPGSSAGGGGNLYLDILSKGLASCGVTVKHWTPYVPFQTGDVFHLHWPATFLFSLSAPSKRYLEPFVLYNLWQTVARVKKRGGRLVWTVHNLKPRVPGMPEDPRWVAFMDTFSAAVDAYILMAPTARDEVVEVYPNLRDKKWGVAHHPHYRETMLTPTDVDYRAQFGIDKDAVVLGLIGSLQKGKGVQDVIGSFSRAALPGCVLFLAGRCDDETQGMIAAAQKAGAKIHGLFRHLSDQEIIDFHAMIDATIFPSSGHLNSATVFQSLSCNVPVHLRWTPTNQYLQDQIGTDWLSFIGDDLVDSALVEKLRAARLKGKAVCPLDAFSPDKVVQQHVGIYSGRGLQG